MDIPNETTLVLRLREHEIAVLGDALEKLLISQTRYDELPESQKEILLDIYQAL